MLKVLPIQYHEKPIINPIGESGWLSVELGTLPPESILAVESLNSNRKFSFELGRERVYGYALDATEEVGYARFDRVALALRKLRVEGTVLTIDIKPVGLRSKQVLEAIERGTASFDVLVESRSRTDVTGATSGILVIRDDQLSASFK